MSLISPPKQLALAAFAVGLTLSAGANATPVPVTFNPGVFAPGSSTFTADVLNLKDYSRVDLGATSGGLTSFTDQGFLQVNNVSLGSNTYNPTGNRSAYSLYFDFKGAGTQSAPTFGGNSQGTYTSLTYTLYGAVGNSIFGIDAGNSPTVSNSGAVTALAHGDLIAGTTSFTATPLGAAANIDATFVQDLANFILSPANATLELFGAFNNNQQIITVFNGGRSFALNGGGGDISFTAAVPEPASLLVLGSGLVGLGTLVRRRKSA